MISRSGKQTVAKFGGGTVVVSPHMRPDAATLTLTECKQSIVGADVPKKNRIKGANEVVLTFNSVESLDVIIERLQYLKDELNELRG